MWTHTAWPGHSLAPGERLRSYASHCNAVEGNTTFYAIPSRATVQTWAEQTSPDFRFVVKLPKVVTHERRLSDVNVEMRTFLDAVEPLGERIDALWVQLPGSFGPGDVPVLERFLRRIPAPYRSAVEVRHRDFFTDQRAVQHLERALGTAEWVPFDTVTLFQSPPTSDAERDAWSKKPRVPRRMKALTDRPIVRYLGRDDPARTVEGWRPWVEAAAGWLREGRSPTIFIHTPDNAGALMLARRFHDEVRAEVPELEALPEPIDDGQPTLF